DEAVLVFSMTRWVMHVDMDAFYASVEQYRVHPEYRGLPVCVGHDPKSGNGRGVVLTASYEARGFGIHSGMPVTQAYRLCPEAVFVRGSFSNYLEASDEVMTVVKEFADGGKVRRASIDEAYIEVTQKVSEYSGPKELASKIQQSIWDQTKLPCSIGIAPNMAVAKIATGMKKPMGITLVPQNPESVAQFLAPLAVSVINGVGRVTTKQLNKFGINTLGQIQQMSLDELQPIMRKGAKWLYDCAWGIDDRPLISSGPRIRKSISKDRTFLEDIEPTEYDILHETLNKICTRIGQTLQAKALHFRTVTIKLRFSDFSTIQRSRTLNGSTSNQQTLCKIAKDIFEENLRPDQSIRLLGIKVSNLTSRKGQASLSDYF
ncbi:MAG: DNA polymerase IV, partial [Promethearchaeota archaeon]